MNKKNCLKGIIGKPVVTAIVSAVLFIASVIVAIFVGFNTSATLNSASTLTVKMYKDVYEQKLEKVEDVCEAAFGATTPNYQKNGETSGLYSEIVYVFDEGVNLSAIKTSLEKSLESVANDIDVTVGVEKVEKSIPTSYIVRMAIAVAVFAVLAFLYVTLRHKFAAGFAYALSVLMGGALTFALVTLVRIPVSGAITYIVAFGMIVSAVIAMLNYRNIIEAEKALAEKQETAKLANALSSSDEEKADEEPVKAELEDTATNALAVKETVWFASAIAFALILMLAFGPANIRLFALNSIVALVCATFTGLIIAPSLYIPFKKKADKKQAERARYDYKKAKKSEKTEQ